MDVIFGTLATDELKLVHHRAARYGLQHAYNHTPLDPLPGEPVTITAYTGTKLSAQQVACYYTRDGSQPEGNKGKTVHCQVLKLEPVETIWDTLVWGYVIRWQGVIPAQPDGTKVQYMIGAWSDDGSETFADYPLVQDAAEQASIAFFRNEPLPDTIPGNPADQTIFAYHVDRLKPPDWAYKAIIYHVFIDRFYPGKELDWQQTDDLIGVCGGTLWGVHEKLDYIADLGVNCIWLSPTFASPTSHGYDVIDYLRTEARLGGDEALHAVIEGAHQRNLRVLLDLPCSHVSDQHAIFQEALRNPDSIYRNWFYFNDSEIGYRAFFGVQSMPQINTTNPEARAWLCGVGSFWLREFDIDGYRLDYANGPGPAFWADFRAACKSQKADAFCFGEVIDAPDAQRTYVGCLDGCLDFHTSAMIRRAYGWDPKTSSQELERFVACQQAFFPENFVMPTFLDNHDMDRFLWVAKGDKDALRKAAEAQMRLPGPPIIFYGTEVGLNQRVSTRDGGLHLSRVLMPWNDSQDAELLKFYKALIRERHNRF